MKQTVRESFNSSFLTACSIKPYISLIRPKQWTKNLLLFAGLIFSQNFLEPQLVLLSIKGFLVFCFIASAAYILNDMIDLREDRNHPDKMKRPLASGVLAVENAIVLLAFLLVAGSLFAWSVNPGFFLIVSLYFVITVSYSLWFKNLIIIDVFFISLGFIIRAVAGAVAIDVHISSWLLFCTMVLSLFLALTKRRSEFIALEGNGANHRKVLGSYTVGYLDQLISIVTALTIISYSLYTITASETEFLMLTIPFVVYGVFRYLLVMHLHNEGGKPEELLLKDTPLLICVTLWALSCVLILYLDHLGWI